MGVLDQLVEFYHREEWHATRISDDEARAYYMRLFQTGRIITCMEGDLLLGYVEFTRVNLTQLGYLMLADTIDTDIYDPKGHVVYVSGLYIPEQFRSVGVIQHLKREIIAANPDAQFLVGETQGRHRKSWAVYRINKGKGK